MTIIQLLMGAGSTQGVCGCLCVYIYIYTAWEDARAAREVRIGRSALGFFGWVPMGLGGLQLIQKKASQ